VLHRHAALVSLHRHQTATARARDAPHLPRHGVLGVDLLFAQLQPRHVRHLLRVAPIAHHDPQRDVLVRRDATFGHLHAPRSEECGKIRGLVGVSPGHAGGLIGLAERIQQQDQPPAAQDELVERVLHARFQGLGVHDEQDRDIRGNLGELARVEILDVVESLELVHHLPLAQLLGLAGLRVEAVPTLELQRADPRERLLLRARELGDQLARVVLEESLPAHVKDWHHLARIDGVRPHKPKVQRLSRRERHRPKPCLHRGVLLLAEGLGIHDAKLHLAL
jgi:hypothetical protein